VAVYQEGKVMSEETTEHLWSVGETSMNDQPFIVRFNTSVKSREYQNKFPIKVGFAIPFNTVTIKGLPESEEVEQLNHIEDQIISLIKNAGVQALSLTTGGIREFIFYVQSGTDIGSIHQKLLNDIKTHEVQCMAVKDPNWDTYDEYTPS
jgi:hypothetical protein